MAKSSGPKPESAAQKSVDPDRLLPGEVAESDRLDTVHHWVAVYKDLLDTKKAMLRAAESRIATASADAQKEFGRTDRPTLGAERRRLERRLAFWRRRLREANAKPD